MPHGKRFTAPNAGPVARGKEFLGGDKPWYKN
jgi:hypothetical protein